MRANVGVMKGKSKLSKYPEKGTEYHQFDRGNEQILVHSTSLWRARMYLRRIRIKNKYIGQKSKGIYAFKMKEGWLSWGVE